MTNVRELRQTPPSTEAELIRIVLAMLRERLPHDWTIEIVEADRGPKRPDAIFNIGSPDGTNLVVIVESKRLLESRDVSSIHAQLERIVCTYPGAVGMVAARYLAKSARERLAKLELSYADATGNLLLRGGSPALFIADRGADSDPWRGPGRPRGTLKGDPAAKVVRTLADLPGPWKIRELVEVAASSTGSVYRVLDFLEAEGLAMRDEQGLVTVQDWPALLRRWSKDYQFLKTNSVSHWIAPRGIDALLDRIRQSEVDDYAVTGSIAAATWAPYAPIRAATIYSARPEISVKSWGLRPTDRGANVILAKPKYDVVFRRVLNRTDGLKVASPTQVAVDLMSGPGRAPSEAEELIDWMVRNEQSWR